MIGEKSISQVQEESEEAIYSYTFVTSDSDKTYDYFQSLNANCDRQNGNVTLVMKRDEIPGIIKMLIGMGVDIYAVNQRQRTLEQDFITMTTGTKSQIR